MAGVGLIAGAVLTLLANRVLVAVVLLLAAAWIFGGLISELRARRCETCGEKFCRRCEALQTPEP